VSPAPGPPVTAGEGQRVVARATSAMAPATSVLARAASGMARATSVMAGEGWPSTTVPRATPLAVGGRPPPAMTLNYVGPAAYPGVHRAKPGHDGERSAAVHAGKAVGA
jgi:hypothetical protein